MIIKVAHRGPLFDHDDGAVRSVVDRVELAPGLQVYGGNSRPERLHHLIMLSRGGMEVRGDDNGCRQF